MSVRVNPLTFSTLCKSLLSHHYVDSTSLYTFNGSFCHFTGACSFPPKIRTTILGVVLVQRRVKALGGMENVMNPISTDSILVDHMTLLLMGSTGRNLEV